MQTKLKNTGVLVGFVLVCLVAEQLEGEGSEALAVGAIAGYLLGAAITLWGIAYQKHIARTRPAALWQAYAVSFMTKFAGLAIGPAIAVLLPSLAERCDWRSLILAYGFAAVLVLLLGSPEVSRALKPSGPKASSDSSKLDDSDAVLATAGSLATEQAPLDPRTCT